MPGNDDLSVRSLQRITNSDLLELRPEPRVELERLLGSRCRGGRYGRHGKVPQVHCFTTSLVAPTETPPFTRSTV